MKVCSNCQCRMEDDLLFCTSCGKELPAPSEKPAGKKRKKKWIILTAILLAVAIAGGTVLFFLLRQPEVVWGGAFYDGTDWYLYTSAMEEPLELDLEDGAIWNIQRGMRLTSDGKYLIYEESGQEESTLYCRSLQDTEQAPVKLSFDYRLCYLTEDPDCVYYLSDGTDGKLYRYRISTGKKETVEKYVQVAHLRDEKRLLYSDQGFRLMLSKEGYPVELPADIDLPLNTVRDVKLNDDGSCYVIANHNSSGLLDYFENDLGDTAEAANLQNALLEKTYYPSLYYCKDGRATLLTVFVTGGEMSVFNFYDFSQDEPAAGYYAPSRENKIPLSQVRKLTNGAYIVDSSLWDFFQGHLYLHIAQGEQTSETLFEMNRSSILNVGMNADGSFVYAIENRRAGVKKAISVYAWGDEALQETELSVSAVGDVELYGNFLLYVQESKLYLQGQEKPFDGSYSSGVVRERGKDVLRSKIDDRYVVCPLTGALYYWTETGTLKVYQDGKSSPLVDNVDDCVVCDNGTLWLMVDGACMVYDGEELTTVQEGVEDVLPVSGGGYIGY